MDDQVRIRVRTFSAQLRFRGCMIETVPGSVRKAGEIRRFSVAILIRNAARYLGLTPLAFYRAVRVEFGSHYLHMIQSGENNAGDVASVEEIEARLGFVMLRLVERYPSLNRDYRSVIDSLVEKYELPAWRIFVGVPGDKQESGFMPDVQPGEISLFVQAGEFR